MKQHLNLSRWRLWRKANNYFHVQGRVGLKSTSLITDEKEIDIVVPEEKQWFVLC